MLDVQVVSGCDDFFYPTDGAFPANCCSKAPVPSVRHEKRAEMFPLLHSTGASCNMLILCPDRARDNRLFHIMMYLGTEFACGADRVV
jgi:hypothetical protein